MSRRLPLLRAVARTGGAGLRVADTVADFDWRADIELACEDKLVQLVPSGGHAVLVLTDAGRAVLADA